MAQANDALYAALLDGYANAFPAGSTLELRAGENVLAKVPLPALAWKRASGRVLDSGGAWSGTAAGSGMVDNYVLRSPDGAYEDAGKVSMIGGDGDMQMDNPVLARNQAVSITSFRKEF